MILNKLSNRIPTEYNKKSSFQKKFNTLNDLLAVQALY